MAVDLALALDPGAAADLALALDPVPWARALDFDADPWQAKVLRSDAPRLLLNCSRQSGKSTTAALLALHLALYRPDTLALLLSPSLRQSSELFRKVTEFYRLLVEPMPVVSESALRLELMNRSRIVSLPGKEATIRGYSGVDLLVVDEASRVPDDLYYAIRPMLAVSGGRLLALSTPFGARGWWWQEWTRGGDGWERVEVTAYDCPRISAGFLEEERLHLGNWWYEQEYECVFRDARTTLFSWNLLEQTISEEAVETWAL